MLGAPLFELCLDSSINGTADLIGDLVDVEAEGRDWIRYRTDDLLAVNPAVLDRLAQAGRRVVTLSEVPRSLEDVYLQVVNKASSLEEVGVS